MKAALKGDLFVLYKLDRLARSTKELYEITEMLKEQEIDFVPKLLNRNDICNTLCYINNLD
ncbi:recombinase family protein [Lysinibacillus contaminans]|uniref:recombinase family protein n=1 Tax=Lysinibacillus contaminans TaxID=1293441 RepID=UPI001FE08969|nr:recombinase family protein [Lysinibacillus contaminans]